jgi:TetR/AcrR family transcriptional repressor of mexJK operon
LVKKTAKSRNETIAFHFILAYSGGMDKPVSPPLQSCPSAAGRPRATDVESRMHNLVHCAGQLFIKLGYNKVSLEMIAREAHVAVRTIYVKFGGKPGLLKAVLAANRERFFDVDAMDTDTRPIREVIDQFSEHLLELLSKPEAISMCRMVIADAPANPELARAFFDAGPVPTKMMLVRYFARPDIEQQLHPEMSAEVASMMLMACISGNQLERLLFSPAEKPWEQYLAELHARLAFFYRAALHTP